MYSVLAYAECGFNLNSAVKVLKNRIVLIMRVNPEVQFVSMVSVSH
jgi:hypothetical protein